MSNGARVTLFALLGAILGFGLGLVIVKALLLDAIESILVNVFLDDLVHVDLSRVVGSAIFLKFVVGGLIGALLGALGVGLLARKKRSPVVAPLAG